MASDFLMCACSSDMCFSSNTMSMKSDVVSETLSLLTGIVRFCVSEAVPRLLSGIVWVSRVDDVRWAFLKHHVLMKSDVCF
jgi:hypothetical protein